MVFSVVDSICQKGEMGLSIVDAMIFGPNLISGPARVLAGKVQAFGGALSFVVHYGASLLTADPAKERILEAKAVKSLEIIGHGLLNIIRGIAATCFLGLFLLLFYDIPGWHILQYRDIDYYASQVPLRSSDDL